MGTVKLDINGINNKVKPPLNYSIRELNSSISIISSVGIPGDFAYASTLRGTINTINSIKERVNNIYKWADNVTVKFQQVEQKNASVLDALAGTLTNMSKVGAKVSSKKSVGIKAGKKISGIIISAKNAIATGAKISTDKIQSIYKDTIESIKLTKTKIVTEAETLVSKMQKVVSEKMDQVKELTTNALTGINLVGSKITKKCENFYKAEIEPELEEAIEFSKAVFADTINMVNSVIKGLGEFGENLVDLQVILGTVMATTTTGMIDGITYITSKITGNTEEWESQTSKLWEKTMAFVAEEHVKNAFESFYNNTAAGQWLDEHAHEWFKSDGIVSDIATGIGEVMGVVLLSVLTLGTGGIAIGASEAATMTATTAITAGLAGTGKYTEQYWVKVKNSSWEGIEEMYKNGELSEEEYTSLQQIRNLSDEEWEAFTAEYEKGNISQEDYEMIQQIREISENWATLENAAKGLGYGIANGAWEGLQWYVGGKLGGWTMKSGSKLATSGVRVAADTGFNALDTPFRTTIEAITSDETWQEAWEKQGGWRSVLTTIGIGLMGSAGGEAFNAVKMRSGYDATTKINTEAGLGNETTMLEKLKNKFKKNVSQETNQSLDWSKFNTSDIDFGEWVTAKNAYMKFFEENAEFFKAHGITMRQVEENFNKVMLCSDPDYFNFVKTYFGRSANVTAFNYQGFVFAPSYLSAKDIAHEVTHSWGRLYWDATGNFNRDYNTISEALTETIACSMGLDERTTVIYTCNVEFINKISQQLDNKGYKNAFFDAYIAIDSTKIKNIVDGIAGEGYYDELARKFSQNQEAFIKGYSTGDWVTYSLSKEELNIFLRKLD